MMPNIQMRIEGQRGCGFRKPGGLYLVKDGGGKDCGKLPLILDICPCCGAGIKPARGWTWIDADKLFEGVKCKSQKPNSDNPMLISDCLCPLNGSIGRAGLIWIGEKYYKSPAAWLREAAEMGISRRINAIPRDFKIGETWVCLAHRLAIEKFIDGKVETNAAIFSVFKPQRIEYVVKDDDTNEFLESMEERGITLVKIQKRQQSVIGKD